MRNLTPLSQVIASDTCAICFYLLLIKCEKMQVNIELEIVDVLR
nr:MAG TPA: hypothetical protein [Caudoviricetes sp.]